MTHHSKTDMLGRRAIPGLDRALTILETHLRAIEPVGTEEIDLHSALGRICGREITAPEDLPPWPRSTMDGYAVRAADTFGAVSSMPVYLTVKGEIRMGERPSPALHPQECLAVATGGILPPSTDAVVMLEQTVPVDDRTIEVIRPVAPGENCLAAGDDVRRGMVVIEEGRRLRPQEIGLLAGLGLQRVTVRRPLRIAVFSTGDEVVPYTEAPGAGQIRDINSIHLQAMVRQLGEECTDYGITRDEETTFRPLLDRAVAENDLVLFSGGSSVGSRDLGEELIARLGPPGIVLHGAAIRPGKPVIVGLAGNRPLFGLPGHPVSCAVCFELFVKPVIRSLRGEKAPFRSPKPVIQARCGRNVNSAAGVSELVRVQLVETADGLEARPILGKSGALRTMVRADGYFFIHETAQGVQEGEMVQVYPYE